MPRVTRHGSSTLFFGLAVAAIAVMATTACRPAVKGLPKPEKRWKKMSHDERFAYMTEHVEPHMQEVFQEFDAERYAEFSCATCHQDGDYSMPSAELLPLARHKFRERVYDKHPEEVRFMWEKVEPNMAALLGKRANFFAFNCRECHTTTK